MDSQRLVTILLAIITLLLLNHLYVLSHQAPTSAYIDSLREALPSEYYASLTSLAPTTPPKAYSTPSHPSLPKPPSPDAILEPQHGDAYAAKLAALNKTDAPPSRAQKPLSIPDQDAPISFAATFEVKPTASVPFAWMDPKDRASLGTIRPTETAGPYPPLVEGDREEYVAICMTGKSSSIALSHRFLRMRRGRSESMCEVKYWMRR